MPTYLFLALAIDASGHVMSTLGFAEGLRAAGHEVVFAHREIYRRLIEERKFSFIPLEGIDNDAEEPTILMINAFADKFRKEPLECFREMAKFASFASLEDEDKFQAFCRAFIKIINERKNEFDAIIADLPIPRTDKDFIPWFPLVSTNPLALYPSGPPLSSGYSVKSDKSKWEEFRDVHKSAHTMLVKMFCPLWEFMNFNAEDVKDFDFEKFFENVQSTGFFQYPADLDYIECGPRRPNWQRVDCWVRKPEDETAFTIPEKLQDKPGKLIYFSLGTLGSVDITIMKKLIDILSKSPHRFIVSKGPRGDSFELADNMWGANHVNQIKIIEKVDLVITHGGNNTFLETLYYGKPMIVIPYFYDQYDNAQRVVDKKIGFRINSYEIEEDYLLDCIEKTINDESLQNRIKAISQNMRNSNSLTEAIKTIEKRIELHKARK